MDTIFEGAFSTAKDAVDENHASLLGLWAVWLGVMRLAERVGLLARALRRLMRRLFPDVSAEHPAEGDGLHALRM